MRTFFILATAVIAVTACGGDKPKTGAVDATPPATAVAAAPAPMTITAKNYSYEAPDTVAAGMVTIRLVNEGADLHHATIIRLTDGRTLADLAAELRTEKPDAQLPAWTHEIAGPNATVPGGEQSIIEQLDAGNYAIVCFIPSADGVPHFVKGMMRGFTVVPSTLAVAPPPTADVNVSMVDYAWQITPDITAGKHILKIENAAGQSHEMVIAKLDAGKTPADIAQWLAKQVGPMPGKPMGGITGMSKGSVAYLPIDLEPGNYGIFCFLNDAKDGKPHVEHGMLKQIAVK
jgi:hypothetical protein